MVHAQVLRPATATDVQPVAATAADSDPTVATPAALVKAPTDLPPSPLRRIAPTVLRPVLTVSGWKFVLHGLAQVEAVAWSQASQDELSPTTGEPLNQTRFMIRRARLRAHGERGAWAAMVEFDGNTVQGTASARLLASNIQWTLPSGPRSERPLVRSISGPRAENAVPLLRITAGLLRTPFGAEVPLPDHDKILLEAPTVSRALFPGFFDAGVMADGGWRQVRWSLAIMNGAPVGDAQFKGRDPSQQYDIVAHVGGEAETAPQLHFSGGVSVLQGRGLSPGTPPTKDALQWVDGNNDGIVQTTELQVIPGGPGRPSATFARRAVGINAAVQWCLCRLGQGSAFAEITLAQNLDRGVEYADPIAAGRNLRELGGYIGVVQNLGSVLMVGARYDRYQPDRDRNSVLGTNRVLVNPTYATMSVLLAARLGDVRMTAQYDHERNPLGRADDGSVTTRADDRLTLRAQAGF